MVSVEPVTVRQNSYCQVAIVDDEPGMRVMLGRLFESAGISYRSYESAESLLEDRENINFGCLIVDVRLSGISGLDLQAELRRVCSDIAVVFISGQATLADAIRAFRDKASAFFEKPFQNSDLLATVQELVANWSAIHAKRQRLEEIMVDLSPREKEVLAALTAGKKTTQIAHELGISTSTVEKHRVRVFQKTGADSIVELVRLTSL